MIPVSGKENEDENEKRRKRSVDTGSYDPVMFFILLFLIYTGNMFYIRSQVDSIASRGAIQAAAYVADPMLEEVKESGSVPRSINNVQPYHSLLGNDVGKIQNKMNEELNGLGTGFFAGMGIQNHSVSLRFENHIFYSTVTADVDFQVKFPIRFFGSDQPVALKMHSRSVAPVTDTPEFIQNVDMAIDYADSTGLSEKLNQLTGKVREFFGR